MLETRDSTSLVCPSFNFSCKTFFNLPPPLHLPARLTYSSDVKCAMHLLRLMVIELALQHVEEDHAPLTLHRAYKFADEKYKGARTTPQV